MSEEKDLEIKLNSTRENIRRKINEHIEIFNTTRFIKFKKKKFRNKYFIKTANKKESEIFIKLRKIKEHLEYILYVECILKNKLRKGEKELIENFFRHYY